MFGFGRKPDHFNEFMEYLIEDWHMNARYASAFLSAYRTDISVYYDQGIEHLNKSIDFSAPENRLLPYTMPDPRDLALVGQAHKAYLKDLRRGKHVGTDVEVAIWAILCNRSDLLESVDKLIATYVTENQARLFPNLFDEVFP